MDDVNNSEIKGPGAYLNGTDCLLIIYAKNIGAGLNIRGTTLTGIILGAA